MQMSSATVSDVKAIQSLLRDTWRDTYGDYLSKATLDEVYKNWQSIEFLTRQIENIKMFFPIVKEGGETLGIATSRLDNFIVQLFRLYVSPKAQRKGVGSLLLTEVAKHYPNAKKIQLHVEVMNEKGQAFYKKHGFLEVSRDVEKIGDETLEQMLMEKNI